MSKLLKALLTHYSPKEGLKEIDPEKRGMGVDIKRNISAHPISYYYQEGAVPESVVTDPARQKYTVKLPEGYPIYDLGTDKEQHLHNLIEGSKSRQVNAGIINNDDIHAHLKGQGFKGFTHSTHPEHTGIVGLYEKQPVEEMGKSESDHRVPNFTAPRQGQYGDQHDLLDINFLKQIQGNPTGHKDVDALKSSIQNEGLKELPIMSFDPQTKSLKLGEGNHRVEALRQLGYTHVPVISQRGGYGGKHFPELNFKGLDPNNPNGSYVPADLPARHWMPQSMKDKYLKQPVEEMGKNELKKSPMIHEGCQWRDPIQPDPRSENIVSHPVDDGLHHHVFQQGNHFEHILSKDPNPQEHGLIHIAGQKIGDTFHIGSSNGDPYQTGKGYGKKAYAEVLKHHGKIASDSMVSHAADKIYRHLKTLPNTKVSLGRKNTSIPHRVTFTKSLAKALLEKGQNGDWQKEGYKLTHRPTGGQPEIKGLRNSKPHTGLEIYAHHHGKEVGKAILTAHPKEARALYPLELGIDKEHRRKGLASAMYSHAEKISGKKVLPSDAQSPSAKKLWAQPNVPFGKSELEKGSWQRKNKFNPQKDTSSSQAGVIRDWQEYGEGLSDEPRTLREDIGFDEGNIRNRFLHKLSAATKARHSPVGGREFLLHRGVSNPDEEFSPLNTGNSLTNTHVSHENNSSWTPRYDIAENFSGSNPISAWIHENSILTVPKQYGQLPESGGRNDLAPEHEVIVGPHKSERTRFTAPVTTRAQPDLNERINKRGTGSLFNQPSHIIAQRRMKKSLSDSLFEALQKNEDHGVCTMFMFEGCDIPDVLHCTHHYMGKGLTDKDIEKIKDILIEYFKEKPFKTISKVFDKEEFFGENKDVRVLRPESKTGLLLDLRDQLNQLYPDKWPEYKPHVSVSQNVDKIDAPIVNYILCKGGKILWQAIDDLNKSELNKERPVLKFPNLNIKANPNQDIRSIATPRQKEIAARSQVNEMAPKNFHPVNREHAVNKLENQIQNTRGGFSTMKTPNEEKNQNQKGMGWVRQGAYTVKRGGGVPYKQLTPEGKMRQDKITEAAKVHEAHHKAYHDLRQKLGTEPANALLGSYSNMLDPDIKNKITHHLYTKGYGNDSVDNEEILNHIRDIISMPDERKAFHFNTGTKDPQKQREIESHLKSVWNQIYKKAKRL